MAETIKATQFKQQYLDMPASDGSEVNVIDLAGMDSFVCRLHEALDFYQLFDTFIDEFRAVVSCDSIEYNDETTQTSLINGIAGRLHRVYELSYNEQSLGRISIKRDTVFKEQEIEIIEVMLAGLTLPLRNALRYKQAIRLAQRDALTGLRNGSYYHDHVDLEIKRAQRYKKPFSLLMFDLDNFEGINQQHGRCAGDAVLIEVAKRIKEKARSSDIVYRNGGDEFLVFLPHTDKPKAIEAAERIKDFVIAEKCEYQDEAISFTLSAGVVTVTYVDTVSKLLDRASKSLFHAKILGKNRIYGELPPGSIQAEYL